MFLRVDDKVFHTYSSFARGAEWTGGSYAFLDLTALGRQEDWEEPKGRSESVRAATPDFATSTGRQQQRELTRLGDERAVARPQLAVLLEEAVPARAGW